MDQGVKAEAFMQPGEAPKTPEEEADRQNADDGVAG